MRVRNKFGAKKTKALGRTYDSKAEAARALMLTAAQADGRVTMFLEQVPFRLAGGTVYKLDFMEFWATDDGVSEIRYVDVKSPATAKESTFRVKKREIEHKYGIQIECIDRNGNAI